LSKAGLSLQDVDLFEINEAFAAQLLACQKDLGIDMCDFAWLCVV
jgi:acetyl-CoA C-acetyltransferase